MMIFEWATLGSAQTDCAIIDIQFMAYAALEGYTVDQEGVIGKINGVDVPTAQKTTAWGEPMLSPDNTYYIQSPTSETWHVSFVGTFTEKQRPEEWDV